LFSWLPGSGILPEQTTRELGDKYPGLLHDLGFREHKKHWLGVFISVCIILGALIITGSIIIELLH